MWKAMKSLASSMSNALAERQKARSAAVEADIRRKYSTPNHVFEYRLTGPNNAAFQMFRCPVGRLPARESKLLMTAQIMQRLGYFQNMEYPNAVIVLTSKHRDVSKPEYTEERRKQRAVGRNDMIGFDAPIDGQDTSWLYTTVSNFERVSVVSIERFMEQRLTEKMETHETAQRLHSELKEL